MPLPSRIRATIQHSKRAKGRSDLVGPPLALRVVQPLEDDLGHELDVASFAGADGWSAVEVADCVGHLAKATVCGAYTGHSGWSANAADGANSGGQVDAVEQVKEVRPELDFDPLGDWNILDKRQVHISKARPGKFVSREVCRAWARRPARRAERSGVPPLRPKGRVEFVTDTGIWITD